jgi:hypothetical protein
MMVGWYKRQSIEAMALAVEDGRATLFNVKKNGLQRQGALLPD